MKCHSTYMIKSESMLCNKSDEITMFFHTVVRIFCPVIFKIIRFSLVHVAFTKVMLKIKEQQQIVSNLLL